MPIYRGPGGAAPVNNKVTEDFVAAQTVRAEAAADAAEASAVQADSAKQASDNAVTQAEQAALSAFQSKTDAAQSQVLANSAKNSAIQSAFEVQEAAATASEQSAIAVDSANTATAAADLAVASRDAAASSEAASNDNRIQADQAREEAVVFAGLAQDSRLAAEAAATDALSLRNQAQQAASTATTRAAQARQSAEDAAASAASVDAENLARVDIPNTFNGSQVITSDTGDTSLTIEADPANANEGDNPYLELVQDGGGIRGRFELTNINSVLLRSISQFGTSFNAIQFQQSNVDGVTRTPLQIDSGGRVNVNAGNNAGAARMTIGGNSGNALAIRSTGAGTAIRGFDTDTGQDVQTFAIKQDNADNVIFEAIRNQLFLKSLQDRIVMDSVNGVRVSGKPQIDLAGGNAKIGFTIAENTFNDTDAIYGLTRNGASGTNTVALSSASAIAFRTGNQTTQSEKVRITGDGKLGIGLRSPDSPLHVFRQSDSPIRLARFESLLLDGSDRSIFDIEADTVGNAITLRSTGFNSGGFKFLTGNDERMHLTTAGDLGIGTTAPDTTLHVRKDSNSPLKLARFESRLLDGSDRAFLDIEADSVGNTISLRSTGTNAGGFKFITGTDERMRLTTAGDLGIGTTTPQAKLDVAGDAVFSGNITAANLNITTERGEWTPRLEDTGNNTISISFREGNYIKVGNLVTVEFWLNTGLINNSPDVTIDDIHDLPFPIVGGGTGLSYAKGTVTVKGLDFQGYVFGAASIGRSSIEIRDHRSGTGNERLRTPTGSNDSYVISGSLTYITNS